MSIPPSRLDHPSGDQTPHRPPRAENFVTRPAWEEGESEQDAEGEDDDEGDGSNAGLDVEEESASTRAYGDDVPSPYLSSHRPNPRITLRVNQRAKSTDKFTGPDSPELMDLDLSSGPPNLPAARDLNVQRIVDRSHDTESTQGQYVKSRSEHSVTPPGSPLRAFIAPAAHPPPVIVSALAPNLPARPHPRSSSPSRPSHPPSGPSSRPGSSTAVYTNGGPSSGTALPNMAADMAPTRRTLGSLWKTSDPVPAKGQQEEQEDVDMGEPEQDEGEDELDDDYSEPARASASASRGKSAQGQGAAKGKRITRGPGKKTKVKVKQQEKEKENVGRITKEKGDSAVEAGPKDGKSEYAYEYVAVSQRKEGRQHIKYEMSMRQQPLQARMCNAGEKADRRPIDPPPIIQLKVIDPESDDASRKAKKSNREASMSYMHNPYFFLYATLVGSDDAQTELHVTDDGKTRFLTGTPVSSLYYLKDVNHRDAAFFVFPDLGVRKEGQYKLKLTLFEIVEQEVFYCATSYTDTFTVLSAKKFPGMQQATALSKSFADQGLKIRVRKEPKKRASGLPPRNKRRSSITEEELYHPKRPRPSVDANYNGSHFSYDPAYPPPHHHNMPPPPVPHHSSRPIVHPPPFRDPTQHLHPQASAPGLGPHRQSMDHSSVALSTGPPPLDMQRAPPSDRADGTSSSHPGRSQNTSSAQPPSHIPPSGASTPTSNAAFFYDERERQRHHEIQLAQRREIDSRRQAEVAKAPYQQPANQQQQQSRQHAQQQQRLQQLAYDQAAYSVRPHSNPPYPPGYGERTGYPSGSGRAASQYSEQYAVPQRPSSDPHGSAGSEFEQHEREKRQMWKAKKQEREAGAGFGQKHGMPEPNMGYPPGYGPDGRQHVGYPEQRYQGQDNRDGGYPHQPQSLQQHRPSYSSQYPSSAPAGSPYYEAFIPTPVRDDRDRPSSRTGYDSRREHQRGDQIQGDTAQRDHYPTPGPVAQQEARAHSGPRPTVYPSSDTHPYQTSTHHNSVHSDSRHSHSASTSVSARSTPQPIRTPQDVDSLTVPSHATPLSQSSGKLHLANHYEPPSRSSLGRLRADEWTESLSSGRSNGSGDREREGLTLPPISALTTPAQSRQVTPSTPAVIVTPGRDHRLGLGHLVD